MYLTELILLSNSDESSVNSSCFLSICSLNNSLYLKPCGVCNEKSLLLSIGLIFFVPILFTVSCILILGTTALNFFNLEIISEIRLRSVSGLLAS